MDTTFWGPSGWVFLHSIIALYPDDASLDDNILMIKFMELIRDILPCKYCRLSFHKYMKTLQIQNYLQSSSRLQEYLYKLHNKVNSKLRKQGYCNIINPDLESTIKKYNDLVINSLSHIAQTHSHSHSHSSLIMQHMINYICNLGYQFIGSIVFNYQGYYANCHTATEKIQIITTYNNFFNILQLILCRYISKLQPEYKQYCNNFSIKKFNINKILTSIEPYTKLKLWFYNCVELCLCKNRNSTQKHNIHNIHNTSLPLFTNYDEYEIYFNKHIVSYCNTPKITKSILNTCRQYKNLNSKHKKLTRKNRNMLFHKSIPKTLK